MKGAQVVLAWDDRRQTPELSPRFFHAELSFTYPDIYVSTPSGLLGESTEAYLRLVSLLRCSVPSNFAGLRVSGSVGSKPSRDSAEAKYHPLIFGLCWRLETAFLHHFIELL
jgi:hypothetical protein